MRKAARQNGFSLIEIMIGLLIGMLSVVIVLQIFSRSDAAKRISNSTDDAQMNALLAANTLEREIRQAGLGFSAFTILGCSLAYKASTDGGTVQLDALAPVTINPATTVVPKGDTGTDTLLVISGNPNGSTEGDLTTAEAAAGATTYAITTADSFAKSEYIVAANATRPDTCALQLATIQSVSGSTLNVSAGASASLPSGSLVYDLGTAPRIRAYAVRNGNLTVCDYLQYNCGNTQYTDTLDNAVWVPVVSQVVGLRAQYARDTSGITGSVSKMTGVVDTYDQTTPGGDSDTATIATACRWARIIGVRLAVVGRATHADKEAPTASNTLSWSGSDDAPVYIDKLTDNWQQFRYRLLESAVPLRNMIWQGSQTTYQGGDGGC